MKNESLPFNPFAQILAPPPSKTTAKGPQSAMASPSKLPQGAKIIGNYLLGKNIGEGTFGKVHMAMHIPTGEKVAIKIIDKSKIKDKDVERVKCEIKILCTTRHRHLIHLYQILQTKKSLLLVMQFMANGELFRHIIKQKKLPEEQACIYFQQIISAIEYLHANKISHRDLKPENILIDFDKQIKVIDFGLSTYYQKNQQLRTYCGSPCYAAPEIVEAKKSYNPLFSDLWSCGVILFAMLCGYLPFCDADTHTLYKKIMSCNYKIPPHVNASAKNLIQSLLVQTPNKRLTIAQIKSHEWFNMVTPVPAYGLNRDQKLPFDLELVKKMKQFGMLEEKIVDSLEKKEKNKETACYFLFMKKMIKTGQKIGTYIGDNNFNPKLIEKCEDKEQDDTHSYTDPVEVSASMIVQSPEAPPIPIIFGNQQNSMPNCQSIPDEWWNMGEKSQQIRQIDERQLMSLANSILDLFMGNSSKLDNIGQILDPSQKTENRIQKLIQQKKQAQFYQNNTHLNKQKTNLHHNVSKIKSINQIFNAQNYKIRSQQNMQKSQNRKEELNEEKKYLSNNNKSQNMRKSKNYQHQNYSQHKQKSMLFRDLFKSIDKTKYQMILPYLEVPKTLKIQLFKNKNKQKSQSFKIRLQSLKPYLK